MPLPLIWIGVGIGACAAGYGLSRPDKSDISAPLNSHDMPDGAVVYCGIYGVFEHTGIWIEGSVVERHGSGLIKAVAPQRFLNQRSGSTIRVACDLDGQPLGCDTVAERAAEHIYQFEPYHVFERNCHRFVSQCLNYSGSITTFGDLTKVLQQFHGCEVRWRELGLD